MNWGDELCGVKVTPESWEGGVIDYGAPMHWRIHPYTMMLIVDMPKYAAQGIPIFPPRGWAGKTDAQLWAAVFGGDDCRFKGEGYDEWELEFWLSGSIWLRAGYPGDGRIGYTEIDKPAALILALQNAQVLARRLA